MRLPIMLTCVAATAVLAAAVRPAKATFTIDIRQVGPNVVSTGTGTIDTAGLTLSFYTNVTAGSVDPSIGQSIGGPSGDVIYYSGASGPSKFGTGGQTVATSGTGAVVGVDSGLLVLPENYVSGSTVSNANTYAVQTLSTLGLTPGTYTEAFGSGADADSFVVEVDAAPEPSSASLMAVVALRFLGRRRRGARGLVELRTGGSRPVATQVQS